MRYVKARQEHECAVCKKTINEGKICIQSQGSFNLFYHEDCHAKRFENSPTNSPTNERPKENDI